MSSPKVCAIIITYNGIKWIDKCLNSIDQSTLHADLFLVDNGSNDGTHDFLKKKDYTFLHISKENLGFGKANNLALKQAYNQGYEYFLLLNQDAWIEGNVIEHLISSMQSEKNFGVVSPLHFNGSGDKLDHLFEFYLTRMEDYQNHNKDSCIENRLYESPFINAACWMLSRNTLEQVGLFHPLFDHYGEDDNYVDRLHYAGLKLGLDPQVKMYHDRDGIEVNILKDDPDRLFRRTILRTLLDPGKSLTDKEILKESQKQTKKLAKKLSGFSKLIFKIKCWIKFQQIKREVHFFNEIRQSELSIH